MRHELVGFAVSSPVGEEARGREATMQVYLPISLVPRLMLAVVSLLTLTSLAIVWLGRYAGVAPLAPDTIPDRLFNVDRELNLPTWYQGSALVFCGVVLMVIAYSHRRSNRSRYWGWWAVLAAGFAGLSYDELAGVHERLIEPMRERLNDPGGLLYFAWVVPGLMIVSVVAAAFVPFLLALPVWVRNGFLLAGALFVVGALGMEMIDGAILSAHGKNSKPYIIAVHFEELLEMLGVMVFTRTLLVYIKKHGGDARLV